MKWEERNAGFLYSEAKAVPAIQLDLRSWAVWPFADSFSWTRRLGSRTGIRLRMKHAALRVPVWKAKPSGRNPK